jgi:eukaryotic-like serine/threonine-protein kinase
MQSRHAAGSFAARVAESPTLDRFGTFADTDAPPIETVELDEESSESELLAFPLEQTSAAAAGPTVSIRTRVSSKNLLWIAATVVLALTAAATVFAVRRFATQRPTAEQPRPATLNIDTRPAGLDVVIDGVRRGVTPLSVSLPAGAHQALIGSGSDARTVPLTLAPGAQVAQYFEMQPIEPVATSGRVSIVTDPPGARVSIDGKPRGTSPLTVTDLKASDHKITATNDAGTVERTIAVAAGATASVMFTLPKISGPVGGWIAIAAPFDVEIAERDEILGTGGTNKIMLAAGRHDLTLANRSLGYRDTRSVDVTAGKTFTVRVEAPKVAVNVNARPWAEVTLDGTSLGQTPMANIEMTIGPHEFVFRHPQFGERRQTIIVSAAGPNRIAVDLTK